MKGLAWSKFRDTDLRAGLREAHQSENSILWKFGRDERRRLTLAAIDSLLSDPTPDMPEGCKGWLVTTRAYLLEHPEQAPTQRTSNAVARMVRARRMVADGKTPVPSKRRIRRADLRRPTPRPAWMSDSDLLPKKPPTRTEGAA